jgi:hypothetical protein
MNEILYCFVLFLSGFITDVIWVFYIKYVSEGKLFIGAFFSVATGICTIIFVEGLINSKISMLFWLAGLFLGTWQAQKFKEMLVKAWTKKSNYLGPM